MQKVKLKAGEQHCQRCFGNQLFYVRVENGRGVPAHPAQGICYRCNGSGKEPLKPLWSDKFKACMRRVFAVIYENERRLQPLYLTYDDIAKKTTWSVSFVTEVVQALRLCEYVEMGRLGHMDYVEATPLGMARYSQFI